MPPKKVSESAESHSEDYSKFMSEMKSMFKDFEQKLTTKLMKKLDDKFDVVLGELREDIGEVKNDLSQVRTDVDDINSQIDGFEKSLDFNSERLETVEKVQEDKRKKMETDLNEKIEALNSKLMMLEKHERKYNLIFHGITEELGEKLYEKMRVFFVRDLELEQGRVEQIYFSNGHRIPSNQTGPRPVIMRFSNFEDRELVLSKAYKLAKTGKVILTDLPVCMKKERYRLSKLAYDIRKNEELKTRIRDKGLEMVLEVRKDATQKWVIRK